MKNVRAYALDILKRQKEEGGYVNLLLNHTLNQADLSREDAQFLTRLVYTTISQEAYLDYWIAPLIEGKRVRPIERIVLRMSLCQMFFFDRVPTYAIIDESVRLIKERRGQKAAGFVNALLHQLAKLEKQPIVTGDVLKDLSLNTSHPLWLVKLLVSQYGMDDATRILEADMQTPALCARVNTLVCSVDAFLEKHPECEKGLLAKDAVILKHGFSYYKADYEKGEITIQDQASQLVSEWLNPQKGWKVLDLCSAPGSKTCHLASLMENQGEIRAFDLYDHKIDLVKANALRMKVDIIEAMVQDATKAGEVVPEGWADAILLDAPCSGLGVLARKPEIRYHDSSVLDKMQHLQRELLDASLPLLKKGGVMVYSTCTLNKKENEKNIAAWINSHPEMKLEKQRTILPFEYGTDGFYMAKMVKQDEEDL